MTLSDPIGDMIARIKNAQSRNYKKIQLPTSKFKTKIAEVLKNEGYIIDYKINSENGKVTRCAGLSALSAPVPDLVSRRDD